MEKHFLLFILLSFATPNNTVYSQKVVTVEMHSIPLFMETDQDVPCDINFDNRFQNIKLIKKINEQNLLSEFQKLLSKFTAQKQNTIDVRGQIKIYYQTKKYQTICFDQFGNFIMHGKYFTNQNLFDLLKRNNLIKYY